MPLSPSITNFGDESHQEGESGLTIDGAGFGPFAGEVWMYASSDRTGAADQLTQSGWNDMQITGVSIPGTPNNSPGTVHLFVKRTDLAWSFPYPFTLTSSLGQSIVAATETDTAVALVVDIAKDIAPATETDAAVALAVDVAKDITAATEADAAPALTGGIAGQSITAATEADTAVPLVVDIAKDITAAAEIDTAIGLSGTTAGAGDVTGGAGPKKKETTPQVVPLQPRIMRTPPRPKPKPPPLPPRATETELVALLQKLSKPQPEPVSAEEVENILIAFADRLNAPVQRQITVQHTQAMAAVREQAEVDLNALLAEVDGLKHDISLLIDLLLLLMIE